MITVSVDWAPLSSMGPGPEAFCAKTVDVRHPAKMKSAHNANRSLWQERFWITMLSSSAPSQSTSRFLHAKTLPRDFTSYGDWRISSYVSGSYGQGLGKVFRGSVSWADGSSFQKLIPTLRAEAHEVIASQYGLDSLKGDVDAVIRTFARVSVCKAWIGGHLPSLSRVIGRSRTRLPVA
jgi:hypothetical protein